jgi:hypothetical protein
VDIVCVLLQGCILYDFHTKNIEISSNKESLIFFFLKLLKQLQDIGTTTAIDIDVYSKFLTKINAT